MEELNPGGIKSIQSDERSYLRFLNLTTRTVEIIWINFTGQYVRYQLLRKDAFVDVNTFKTHPWMAVDVHTKDRMHLDKQYVFYPKTYEEHLLVNNNIINPIVVSPRRLLICITLPVYSLRYNCLLGIRNVLKEPSDVDTLDLPTPIMEDLKITILLRNKFLSVPIVTIA